MTASDCPGPVTSENLAATVMSLKDERSDGGYVSQWLLGLEGHRAKDKDPVVASLVGDVALLRNPKTSSLRSETAWREQVEKRSIAC